ncbi:MAG: hypothetical protein M1828_002652 [Chrysothrix sp. TS-e1954]|nr:MAG: hypothetical protein M1828_002652 [Chrysothrix sp. TS-e1954]
MPELFPMLAVTLLVISLFSGSYLLIRYEDVLSVERLWGYLLFVTLLLWSVLLTPVQLIFSKPQERKPTTSVRLLSDPISSGVKRGDIEADVFAIHGLGSDSSLAWTHLETGKTWLQDFLPRDFSNLRVVSINHDSRWDAYSPIQSLRDYGQVILDAIASLRRDDDEKKRPLILIGHSFGGILLKKALVIGKETNAKARQRSVADNVYAALFFGTPHKGSNFALFGTLSSYFSYWRGSRTDLLEFLTPSSVELDDLHSSFLGAFNDVFVCNFFETIPVRMFDIPMYLVVSKQSAAIDGRKAVPVNADHRGLNKFASLEDENYLRVRAEIENTLTYVKERQALGREKNQFSVPFRIRGVPVVGVFVGRESTIDMIEQYLLPENATRRLRILSLQGPGGIGKSQIALEYATRHQKQYTSVFWVSGRSEQALRLDVAKVAERIPLKSVLDSSNKIPRNEADVESAVSAVLNWFSEPGNGRWLLVIDNVDQQTSKPAGGKSVEHSYDIRDYFPATHQGAILITSRLTYLRQLGKGIDVDGVGVPEGLQILLNSSGRADDVENSTSVVFRLHGLPLALNQAGSYMSETGTSPKKYLELYQHRAKSLLERQPQLAIYENGSIMTTLEMSLEAARIRNPTAARLLQLWAFLDNSDISFDLLKMALHCSSSVANSNSPLPVPNGGDVDRNIDFVKAQRRENLMQGWLNRLAKNEIIFCSAIAILRDFSLIQRNEDLDSFTVHPVVHEWARQRTSAAQASDNLSAAISIIGRAVPPKHFNEAWILQRRLRPHAEHIRSCLKNISDNLPAATSGFHGLAFLYLDLGSYAIAKRFYRRATKGFEQLLGAEDPYTVRAYHGMGLVYRNLEEYEKCRKLWKWTLETSQKTRGSHDPATIRALDDLGGLCILQGRLKEARALLLRALKAKEETLGKDHHIAIDTVRQLGIAERKLGHFEEAEKMLQKVVAVFDQVLGPNNDKTLLAVSDLGALFQDLGRLGEAEEFFLWALAGFEKVLGPNHNHTLQTKLSMGKLYITLARAESAEKLLSEAREGFAISLGAQNQFTIEATECLDEVRKAAST